MTPAAWNFSDLILRTERLHLRPLRETDAPTVLKIRSNRAVARYGAMGPWTKLEQAEQRIARDIANMAAGEHLRLGLVPLGQDDIIGSCSLFRFHRESRRAEIGYDMHPDHWHQGYMHEALCALLHHGFSVLELNRVEADVHPDNVASARTLERLGFKREGVLRERWIVEGEVSDTILHGLLASEWHGGK
jgi:RimJ/RimL family protein N-acetyltransferase